MGGNSSSNAYLLVYTRDDVAAADERLAQPLRSYHLSENPKSFDDIYTQFLNDQHKQYVYKIIY